MIKNKQKSSSHYNINQLRLESWNELKSECSHLETLKRNTPDSKKQKEFVKSLFKKIETVESYFALPGISKMGMLQDMLERNEFTSLAHKITEITKLLVSDRYRSNPDIFDDEDTSGELVEVSGNSDGKTKNYFEVLFVEDISLQEEQKLKSDLNEVATDNDQFDYKIIVQRSFQDALIALYFNSNIQAVVIRYAPPFRSKKITSVIEPFIQNVLSLDMASKPESELGPLLGRLVKKFRPELDTYYVTDTSLGNLKDNTLKTFNRIFYRAEDVQELHLTILRGIYERYQTPFFTAVKEYSKKPTGVFHAMPISRGISCL